MKRDFAPEAPDRLWVADITYVRTRDGRPYLSLVLDTYSRRVVGWSMANNPRTDLVLDAVNMAIYNRRPKPGPIHHPDRGSQYTPVEFGSRPKEAGLLPSMGSVADAYDNPMAEGFVSTPKGELIRRHPWPSRRWRGRLSSRVHRDVLQPPSQETPRPGQSQSLGVRRS